MDMLTGVLIILLLFALRFAIPSHALLENSPAIDQIPAGNCVVSEDQRGIARPQNKLCDIGAFELGSSSTIYLPLITKS